MSLRSLSPIALDIGTHAIRAVQLRSARPRERLAAWAHVPRRTDVWNDEEAVQLVRALRRQGFEGDDAVLAMPAADAGACLLEFRGRSAGVVDDAAIRGELSRVNRLEAGTFEYCAWRAPGLARSESWLAVCTAHERANALVAPLEAAGVRVVAIDAGCFALTRGAWSDLPAASLGVVIHLAQECARFVAVAHEQVSYERVLPGLGWNRVVEQAQSQLGLEESITNELLRAMSGASARRPSVHAGIVRLRPMVEKHMRQLALELRQSLNYLEGGHARLPLAGVALTGQGSTIGGWANVLHSITGTATRIVGARDLVETAPSLDDASGADLALAIGLARYPLEQEATA